MSISEKKTLITGFNVDLNCNYQCEDCEKFFDCTLPQKRETYFKGRMQKTLEAMAQIKNKIVVVGGKGGVGKTLLTANLATALAMKGNRVTILDQVFDAPCIPRMMGVEGQGIEYEKDGLIPAEALLGIQVLSMGLILDEDEVVTWFHDMKRNATEEFLCNVKFGERDYLIVDVPAGTSSDTTNVLQYIPDLTGAIIITVPSEVSQGVAHKAAVLCQKAGVPIFGVVENMSGFTCPECSDTINILQSGGGELLAKKLGVEFLGKIPMDPRVAECADQGTPFVHKYKDWSGAQVIHQAADYIEEQIKHN